jgi:hypothetical protein
MAKIRSLHSDGTVVDEKPIGQHIAPERLIKKPIAATDRDKAKSSTISDT